nr:PIN domain-containing protein [Bacillus licheniformis]
MSKIYVLDTNVLLQDPNSIFSFEDNEVVIPAVVLEEVDSKKRYMDEIGRNARRVSKLIDDLRLKGKLYENVPLPNGGSLRIELNHRSFQQLQEIFIEKTSDNRILAVAKNLSLEEETKEGGQTGYSCQQRYADPRQSRCHRVDVRGIFCTTGLSTMMIYTAVIRTCTFARIR